jgi:diguanylate cyclase (GGDEF)-like protein
VYVRFWGTRGSIPAPGPATIRYGGNTACVQVVSGDGTQIMLDCGTGARALGLHLARTATPAFRLHLFVGHTHWDHIQGFPFFVPAFMPGVELNIYAPVGFQRSLADALAGQMEYAYFPVKLQELRSRIHFFEIQEGFFRLGDVEVETHYLNHTAPTIAYRLTSGGATLAYTTDHEPYWLARGDGYDHPGDQGHIDFLRGADLVIHDAQYDDEEYATKVGWGHSPVGYATDVAVAAGVGRLALFHHDPGHDDAMVERLEAQARERVARAGSDLAVFAAAEGLELNIEGRGASPPKAAVSALGRRSVAGGRVLLVSANREEAAAIEEVLAAEDLTVLTVPDTRAALARAAALTPDLAIVDGCLPDGDGAALIPALIERVGRSNFPVLLLTDGEVQANRGPAPGGPLLDRLAKPVSPPMVHARVRAWLARSLASGVPVHAGAPPTPVGAPTTTAERVALLGDFALFRGLSAAERQALIEDAAEHIYPAGHVIIAEGTLDDRIFIILSGRVRVVEAAADTLAEAVLGGLGEGDLFGELAALTGRARSATVIAIERTRCLAVRQEHFVSGLERVPDLAMGVLRVLARRLHDADRRLGRYAPDTLTGLAGRRAFHDQYRRLAAGARRRKSGVLVLLIDVVGLRTVNDRCGYTAGDDVLRTVADALAGTTRITDLVARYGADEFVVLLLDARPTDIAGVLLRVTHELTELASRRRLGVPVQCRVGTAHRDLPPDTADELMREADVDLRQAQGRLITTS